MAERLYETLKIAVEEGIALNRRMTFGGHSLGGSLSLLLSSLFKLRLNIPAPLIKVTTFGSPPVLSHKNSRGGEGILQVRACVSSRLLRPMTYAEFPKCAFACPKPCSSVTHVEDVFTQPGGIFSLSSFL